jgi:hypothetical protein
VSTVATIATIAGTTATIAATNAGIESRRRERRTGFLGQHFSHHRRFNRARADRVDADALVGVFERGAFGQTDDAVLGRMIERATWQSDESADPPKPRIGFKP